MWPPAALEFLRELEDNNDRDWFKANRARYDEYLVAPGKRAPRGYPIDHPRIDRLRLKSLTVYHRRDIPRCCGWA